MGYYFIDVFVLDRLPFLLWIKAAFIKPKSHSHLSSTAACNDKVLKFICIVVVIIKKTKKQNNSTASDSFHLKVATSKSFQLCKFAIK